MNPTSRLLIAAAALALSACGSKSTVREPTELQDIVNPAIKPTKLWTARAGEGSGGEVSGLRLDLEQDALYTADVNGHVYAYDPAHGKLLWRSQTGARAISGPTVSGDTILLGTLDGEVLALQRSDGATRWRSRASSEVLGAPVTDGDVVIARAVDGRVFGLNTTDGRRVWSFDRVVPNLVLRGNSAPLLAAGRAYIGMDNGRVVGLRVADGQPLWEQVVAVPGGRTELERLVDVDADLIDAPSCLIAASFGGEIACLQADSGDVQWRRAIRSYTGMAVSDERLFVTDDVGTVWALDLASGAAAWKQEDLLYRRLSAPAYFDGYVVVGDLQGYLHWIDPDSGKIVARMKLGGEPIVAAPVAGDGVLYVIDNAGHIAAIADRKPKS